MRFSYILWIFTHIGSLYALSDAKGSPPDSPGFLNALPLGDTAIVVRPSDPSNVKQVAATHSALDAICGSRHVTSQQDEEGGVSWVVTLSGQTHLPMLLDHTWLSVDASAERVLNTFLKQRERRASGPIGQASYYNSRSKDKTNVDETKATRQFLDSKCSNTNERIIELRDPGFLVYGWGHVLLSDAAKAEVVAYAGVIRIEDDAPLFDD